MNKLLCCECNREFNKDELVCGERDDLLWCPDCADENLEECAYCGALRWPEHLEEYEDTKFKSKWNKKRMCIGCIDRASDEDYDEIQLKKELDDD